MSREFIPRRIFYVSETLFSSKPSIGGAVLIHGSVNSL